MKREFEYNGLKIAYDVTGQGSPVMLMHGWGCSSQTVESIAAIARENHTVYNIDLPGFGASTEPDGVWGVEEYTRAVEALCKHEGVDEPTLIGHSFGGRISILFGSRNNTRRIVLVDAAGVKPRRSLGYYYKVYTYKAARRLYRLMLGAERAEHRLDRIRAKRGSSDYAQATPMMRRILSKCVNEDLCHVMPDIKAPTLLIWGKNDTATPLSDAKKMEKLIPDAGLVAFDGCGHYSFLDNPAGFAAVLRSFLNPKS